MKWSVQRSANKRCSLRQRVEEVAMSLDTGIKVMYLNPIGNSDYDQVFADMAKAYKYPATAVDVVSMNPVSVP